MSDDEIESVAVTIASQPLRASRRIKAAPQIRQLYWCDFWRDAILPEMGKTRPVLIVSFRHTLYGHCLVLPISTDPQEGESAKWAHKLSICLDGVRDSWVVCNHPYTVSTARLQPLLGRSIPRLKEKEFNQIVRRMMKWLPVVPPGDEGDFLGRWRYIGITCGPVRVSVSPRGGSDWRRRPLRPPFVYLGHR